MYCHCPLWDAKYTLKVESTMCGILCNFNADYVEAKPLKWSYLVRNIKYPLSREGKTFNQYCQRNPGSVTPTFPGWDGNPAAQLNPPACFSLRCSYRTGVLYSTLKNCLPVGNWTSRPLRDCITVKELLIWLIPVCYFVVFEILQWSSLQIQQNYYGTNWLNALNININKE